MINLRLIGVKDGGDTSAPAVTHRKDIGRITVRPISFQREKHEREDPQMSNGTKAKNASSCGDAFVTNILLA